MTPNKLLVNIPGAKWIDVDVTVAEVEELQGKVSDKIAGKPCLQDS